MSQGLDWHGPSAREALATVDALHDILSGRREWREWGLAPASKFLLMGHSNGGQGAWYLAARHPERVIAGIETLLFLRSPKQIDKFVVQSCPPQGISSHRHTCLGSNRG